MNDPNIIELNVGGEIFTTTVQTLGREISVLSAMLQSSGVVGGVKRDREGRMFIDRDPTHFRWILNYLRDGYLVTLPGTLQDKLELLQEARCYRIQGLINSIEAQSTAQPDAQKDPPTFLTARPSSKGLFYLSDLKWPLLGLSGLKEGLDIVGIKFEEGKDEVFFWTFSVDANNPGTLTHSELVSQSKLMLDTRVAKAAIAIADPTGQQQVTDITFWWEPSNTQYPQLFVRVSRGDHVLVSRGLDFMRTVAE